MVTGCLVAMQLLIMWYTTLAPVNLDPSWIISVVLAGALFVTAWIVLVLTHNFRRPDRYLALTIVAILATGASLSIRFWEYTPGMRGTATLMYVLPAMQTLELLAPFLSAFSALRKQILKKHGKLLPS